MESLKESKEIYVKTNGIKLHTVISGIGKPIILLHGFPEFWYAWKNIILGLKEYCKLITPDLRGYNLSDKPQGLENYKLDVIVDDIKGLSEQLELGKFYLVGHDWGGVVAWAFAEKYPELLNKLIILNAPNLKLFGKNIQSNSSQRKASGYIKNLISPDGADNLLRNDCEMLKTTVFMTANYKKGYSQYDKEKYIEAWTQPGAINGGINYYKANPDLSNWTGIVKVPTLIIWGMKDRFLLPKLLDNLNEFVEDLSIIRSEKASHWVNNDDPELVISSIKEFV
ncbi:MAG: alpha/beta fold hydrolase, partial [Candidatus Thorarchaeota archaeon]